MKTKPNKTLLLGIITFLSSCTISQATPVTISTAQGRGADLNIRGGAFATGNHGTNLLRVRNDVNLQDARKVYLRFDLATLPASIKNATGATLGLQLGLIEGHSPAGKIWTFNVFGLKDGSPDENWSEKEVTWTDAPANEPASPTELTTDASPLGTFTITGTGTVGQKVAFTSPNFLKFLQSDTNGVATLIITRREQTAGADDDVTHGFASKESDRAAAPTLTVDFKGDTPGLVTKPISYSLPIAPVPEGANAAREMNEFWEADRKQMPPKGAVLFMGSSSFKLWDTMAKDFPEIPVINRGFGGSLIQDSTQYLDRIAFPYQPKIIVLCAGTNDLAYGNKKPDQVFQDYQTFVTKVHAVLPDTRIVYVSINPTVARWNLEGEILETNHLIELYNFEHNSPTEKLSFINSHAYILTPDSQPQPQLLRDDHLHFNADGYKLWTSIIKPRLLALCDMDGVARLDAPKAAPQVQ